MRLTTIEVAINVPDGFAQDHLFQALDDFDELGIPTQIEDLINDKLQQSRLIPLRQATVTTEE